MENGGKIVHDFDAPKKSSGTFSRKTILFLALLVVLGIFTGYMISRSKGVSVTTINEKGVAEKAQYKKGDIIGSKDDKTFRDNAEGKLKAGGVDGEGAYHLERPGGDSQNVYLTSSVLDLAPFIDKKVKVWGETHTAEKAGWLMDVGRLQILE